MGERVAYGVRVAGKSFPVVLRKQWYFGGEPKDLEGVVMKIAMELMDLPTPGWKKKISHDESKVDDGNVALRHDLDINRLGAAMVVALYSAPFDSLHKDLNCDIADHGLYEIEIKKSGKPRDPKDWNFSDLDWTHWYINHADVDFHTGKPGEFTCLGEVVFTPGKPLSAVKFSWYFETEYPEE